ncbi:VOC family protein [Marinicrinis sediminis]|uniref:VOC family protein n=1 Tax=Marinicrinis sediminis TaxID=1652465 RepID=A0ABW5RFS9_9BACL
MSKFEYIDNVFVKTKNPKKMLEFYSKTFDLPLVYSNSCVQRLQVGSSADRAMLAIVDENHLVGGQHSLLSFNVMNIEESYEYFMKQGIECDTHIRKFGPSMEYIYFEFRDPDGNINTVVQCPEITQGLR